MITRTTKYTASDGTEHDSPQAAATHELQNYLYRLIKQVWPGISTQDLVELTTGLAHNPEALRDAVNAYFEDLEAHPDVEIDRIGDSLTFDVTKMQHCDGNHPFPVCWDPQCWHKTPANADNRICAVCDGGPGNDGVCLCGEERWVEPDPDADELGCDPAYFDDGEVAPGVRGFEMEVDRAFRDMVYTGTGVIRVDPAVMFKPIPMGDPDDPTTWRADLPVDHPNYCRPFGTKEN